MLNNKNLNLFDEFCVSFVVPMALSALTKIKSSFNLVLKIISGQDFDLPIPVTRQLSSGTEKLDGFLGG